MVRNVILLLLSIAVVSCQKVIDLELDSTQSRLVIQGNIYNSPGPYEVTISKTVDFDQSNEYPPVSHALVIIADNHGMTDTLKERSSGHYMTDKIVGTPGYTYTLVVEIQDDIYTSISTMPEPVDIDSIYTENAVMDNKILCVSFSDPANEENYYKIVEFKNSKQMDEFHVTSDDLHEGEKITYKIMARGMDEDDKIESGDLIGVWLETIDRNVYDYFRTAGQDGSQSASPSNPISNISPDVLGYFNACSVTKKTYTVRY
jgi:hypothetical protein